MLSGASISETVTTLLCISVAIPLLLAASGCNDRRDVIPDEPRLSEAPRYLLTQGIQRANLPIDTAAVARSGPASEASDEQSQHSALAWLQERQQADMQTVASYGPNDDIRNYPTDYGVIIESDVPQWRASPTLKF